MLRKTVIALLAVASIGLVSPTMAWARGGGGGHGGGGGFGGGFHGDREGRGVSRIRRQQLHHGNGIVCGWRLRTSVGRQLRKTPANPPDPNREASKISRKSNVGDLSRSKALQKRYGSRWSLLRQSMWSLTSQGIFSHQPKETFFNSIGTKRIFGTRQFIWRAHYMSGSEKRLRFRKSRTRNRMTQVERRTLSFDICSRIRIPKLLMKEIPSGNCRGRFVARREPDLRSVRLVDIVGRTSLPSWWGPIPAQGNSTSRRETAAPPRMRAHPETLSRRRLGSHSTGVFPTACRPVAIRRRSAFRRTGKPTVSVS